VVRRAARFLVRNQASDGGFALIPGGPSNAQSTAWAVQGLLAAGREPSRIRRGGSRDPMRSLRSLTAASGEVRYSRSSRQTPVWVTAQAVAALARRTLPLKPVPRTRPAAAASAATASATATATATAADGRRSRQSLPEVGARSSRRSALAAASQVPAAGALVSALM
jgi:hypothetical protein